MNHLKRRSICKQCHLTFVRDTETQVYCFGCLTEANYKKHGVYGKKDPKKKKCLVCNAFFTPRFGEGTCSIQCRQEATRQNQNKRRNEDLQKEAEKDGLTEEARRWLNAKPKGPKKKMSYEEINRRAERNRVFGKYSESSLYWGRKSHHRI